MHLGEKKAFGEKQDFARTVASSVSNASWVCVYETIRSSKEIWVFNQTPSSQSIPTYYSISRPNLCIRA